MDDQENSTSFLFYILKRSIFKKIKLFKHLCYLLSFWIPDLLIYVSFFRQILKRGLSVLKVEEIFFKDQSQLIRGEPKIFEVVTDFFDGVYLADQDITAEWFSFNIAFNGSCDSVTFQLSNLNYNRTVEKSCPQAVLEKMLFDDLQSSTQYMVRVEVFLKSVSGQIELYVQTRPVSLKYIEQIFDTDGNIKVYLSTEDETTRQYLSYEIIGTNDIFLRNRYREITSNEFTIIVENKYCSGTLEVWIDGFLAGDKTTVRLECPVKIDDLLVSQTSGSDDIPALKFDMHDSEDILEVEFELNPDTDTDYSRKCPYPFSDCTLFHVVPGKIIHFTARPRSRVDGKLGKQWIGNYSVRMLIDSDSPSFLMRKDGDGHKIDAKVFFRGYVDRWQFKLEFNSSIEYISGI